MHTRRPSSPLARSVSITTAALARFIQNWGTFPTLKDRHCSAHKGCLTRNDHKISLEASGFRKPYTFITQRAYSTKSHPTIPARIVFPSRKKHPHSHLSHTHAAVHDLDGFTMKNQQPCMHVQQKCTTSRCSQCVLSLGGSPSSSTSTSQKRAQKLRSDKLQTPPPKQSLGAMNP